MHHFALLLPLILLLTACTATHTAPTVPPDRDFAVLLNRKPLEVQQARVSAMPFNRVWPGHQRPLDQTELASFATFSMSKPVTIDIYSRRPIESLAIRPTARHIQHTLDKNHIQFQLDRPGYFTIEVNGTHHALHLFADPPEPSPPNPNDPDVLFFAPGIHHPGALALKSNQTVYLAPGAVVHTSLVANGVSNLKILGRGIIDCSSFERQHPGTSGCIRLNDCHNVLIDGPILRDPNVWCLTAVNCSDLTIAHTKLIGLWRYNADGIDICNSQDVTIRDSFVRSFDDSIVLKGVIFGGGKQPIRNVLVECCTIWNDWGRALEIGAETVAPDITDIIFRDCDILRTNSVALDIQHGDRAAIKNILYDNIRWEIDDIHEAPVMQETNDQQYVPNTTSPPRLLVIEIVKNMWSKDTESGTVDGVTLRNIQITGNHSHRSRISGRDATHAVKNVTIQNLRHNNRPLTTPEAANLTIGRFVENVRVLP